MQPLDGTFNCVDTRTILNVGIESKGEQHSSKLEVEPLQNDTQRTIPAGCVHSFMCIHTATYDIAVTIVNMQTHV